MIAQLAPIDPRSLAASARQALEMINDHRLCANAGRYYGRLPHRITRTVAHGLISLGLVRLDTSGPESMLVLSHNGRITFGVMLERKQRRHG